MAYELTAPSYRAKADFAEYRKKFGPGMQWTGSEVVSVKCAETQCNVRLRVDARSPVPHVYDGIISTAVDEVWVLEDGKWWLSVNP
ncbi:MAG: hypothetical protein IPG42_21715 [Betaproteobacteria bacterium]|nr:hypothetical protein [Betaproteobacteria bacterium]